MYLSSLINLEHLSYMCVSVKFIFILNFIFDLYVLSEILSKLNIKKYKVGNLDCTMYVDEFILFKFIGSLVQQSIFASQFSWVVWQTIPC
jgi:hypothetical protein